ncbi:MAG: dihydroneopterin aldolase [Bradymonadaceae bacterium]|nr:dihydroneopterin aldolase [Lujinxingiaceae bacterium]
MRIFVQNLAFSGRHGVYEDERRDGRRFEVDLSVDLAEATAGQSDQLDDTLDYRRLAETILEFGQGPSCILVERLADQILTALFSRHSEVVAASVTIRKYATGVPGNPACVGVQLERTR